MATIIKNARVDNTIVQLFLERYFSCIIYKTPSTSLNFNNSTL